MHGAGVESPWGELVLSRVRAIWTGVLDQENQRRRLSVPHARDELAALGADRGGVERGGSQMRVPEDGDDGGKRHAGGHGRDPVGVAQALGAGLRPLDGRSRHELGNVSARRRSGEGSEPRGGALRPSLGPPQAMHELELVREVIGQGCVRPSSSRHRPKRSYPYRPPDHHDEPPDPTSAVPNSPRDDPRAPLPQRSPYLDESRPRAPQLTTDVPSPQALESLSGK